MARTILKILLALYIVYALLKFFDFFYQDYDRRMRSIRAAYENDGHVLKTFDNIMLGLMVLLVRAPVPGRDRIPQFHHRPAGRFDPDPDLLPSVLRSRTRRQVARPSRFADQADVMGNPGEPGKAVA